jgi:hypothetical protein
MNLQAKAIHSLIRGIVSKGGEVTLVDPKGVSKHTVIVSIDEDVAVIKIGEDFGRVLLDSVIEAIGVGSIIVGDITTVEGN